MKKEKKFFSVNGKAYTIVEGSRWYVEYHTEPRPGYKQRHRAYGQINREKDLIERRKLAHKLAEKLLCEKQILLKTLEKNEVLFRRKTYQTYVSRLNFFYDWLGERNEMSLELEDANDFIKHALLTKSNGTVRGYRRTLSSLYNKHNKLYNPFEKSIQPVRAYKSLYFFVDWQVQALKQYLSRYTPDVWFAAQMLCYCFIRPGEMRKLETTDINLEFGFIELRPEVSKNKKLQKVSIPYHFVPVIKQYIEGRTGLVFTHNGKMLPVNYLNKLHSQALKALDIKGRYAFYSWKHTGAVLAVKAGINLKDLQLQLRHHSLDMVNEYLKNLGVMDSEDLRCKFPQL